MAQSLNLQTWEIKHRIRRNMHLFVLLLCIILIGVISMDIFRNVPQLTHKLYMKIQFWICICFIIDFFIELFISERRMHYIYTHLIFLIVSIPYLSIIEYSGIHFSAATGYFIRFIPLIRGGYALAIIVSWLSYNAISTLLVTYLTILLSTVYFSSLIFYNVELSLNPMLQNYQDALWWAFMNVTTVGSNIFAVTGLGQVLSVLLAAMGMMMFPIFTVFITDRITNENKKRKAYYQQLFGNEKPPKNIQKATDSTNTVDSTDAEIKKSDSSLK